MSEPVTKPAVVDVWEAWSAVMAECRKVAKDSTNTAPGQGGYKFRGIDAVMNAAGPAMRSHGVFVVPHRVLSISYVDVLSGSKQTPMVSVRVMVKYRVRGPMGDHFDVMVPGEAFDSGDKGTAKAMSVAYRTMLLQAMTLPTDDPDPDSETHQRATADQVAKEQADLGRWRGEVAAAGRDRAALSALWARMKAEWETVPWSPERHVILQDAVTAASQPAPPAEERPPAPEEPAHRPAAAEDDPVAQAQAEEFDANWRAKLKDAAEAKDAKLIRQLIAVAKNANAPELKAEGMAALDGLRVQR